MPVTKTEVAVLETTIAVAVPVTKTEFAVPVTNVIEAVVSVLPIVIVQSVVFSDAVIAMSVMTFCVVVPDAEMPVVVPEITVAVAVPLAKVRVCVPVTNTAVAVASGTSIKYHAVPSFAMAQSLVAVAVLVTGKNRFVALTVFGVVVWFLNVTVFAEPIGHAPVNVQTLKTLRLFIT